MEKGVFEMSIFNFIASIFKPAADLVDNLTTTDEERLMLNNELAKIQNNLVSKQLDLEAQLIDAKSKIIVAEANSQSWIARNWRPITMFGFLLIVLCDSFGIATLDTTRVESVYSLLQIGIGGYIIGRSAEKIIPRLKK